MANKQTAYVSDLRVMVFPKPGIDIWGDAVVDKAWRGMAAEFVKEAESLANSLPPGWKIEITRADPNAD